MSPTPSLELAPESAHRSDTRLHRRYPIALDVRCSLLKRGRRERSGFTRSLNISSGGILLEAGDSLPSTGMLELVITWPFLLDGVCPLRLVMRGRIVRSDRKGIAVKISSHEFRTSGEAATERRLEDRSRVLDRN